MSKLRQQRTAQQIKILLSELILRNTRDPRLQEVTITEVRIDRELQYADVYVNALGDEPRQAEVMLTLEGATGYLRRELGSRLRLRTVPALHFHWDPTLAHAEFISQLLDSLDIPAETGADDEEELGIG